MNTPESLNPSEATSPSLTLETDDEGRVSVHDPRTGEELRFSSQKEAGEYLKRWSDEALRRAA